MHNISEIRWHAENALKDIPRLCRNYEQCLDDLKRVNTRNQRVDMLLTRLPSKFRQGFWDIVNNPVLYGTEIPDLVKMFKEDVDA